jgi:hypothetical protein
MKKKDSKLNLFNIKPIEQKTKLISEKNDVQLEFERHFEFQCLATLILFFYQELKKSYT